MKRGIGNNLLYDGETGTFDEFEAAFKYDGIIYGWNEEQKIEAIQVCLTGKAKKQYEQMSETEKSSIKTILEKLKKGCVKSPEYYLNLFYSIQLKPEEKIANFCYEIEKLIVLQ
ncbi:hypothetical protein BpHYR1_004818 [Brachionus plicatilis]|uniref:Uncharacterized protein n=1 Tax=Brachionus plicatilis TaxID=10195 RepID=A0A3M7SSM5_BRAPC|nr:hypothetical protein BpHYR1_004818 [Brachionus plicatilis]